jgi:hypothetical protein
MYDLQHEANSLTDTADFRRRKAEEYPDDRRNIEAAEHLEKLACELPALTGSAAHRRLSRCLKRDDDHLLLEEFAHEYRRRIGFSINPSAKKYLEALAQFFEDRR